MQEGSEAGRSERGSGKITLNHIPRQPDGDADDFDPLQ